jgi:exopolysaccharide biosynthesis predicted pyruvyltransferase EpsI
MGYIEHMRQQALRGMDQLHLGVRDIVLTDFPDHPNVGDSAIAMGQFEFWAERGVEVRNVYSAQSLRRKVYNSATPVLIHGGGNFGGLYRGTSRHRYNLAERLTPEALLIQAPQSVHFVAGDRSRFQNSMSKRPLMRIAVRDRRSYQELESDVEELLLVPDSAHILAEIPAPDPIKRVAVLARTDGESGGTTHPDSFDWPAQPVLAELSQRIRWFADKVPALKCLISERPSWWQDRARRRFQLGIAALSVGEVVVTDRLHAMLLALQMGRPVIAVDNNNQKLTNYAETWFGTAPPDLRFTGSISEGVRLAAR